MTNCGFRFPCYFYDAAILTISLIYIYIYIYIYYNRYAQNGSMKAKLMIYLLRLPSVPVMKPIILALVGVGVFSFLILMYTPYAVHCKVHS